VPELSIRLDESIASGDRVLRLLRELDEEHAASDTDESSDS